MKIQINDSLLDWELKKFTIEPQGSDWEKSYKYLEHAQSLLVLADSEHFYIDVISNLKRSIDHRVKLISKQYDIKYISKLFGIKGSFDMLTELSLVRKLMVNKLMELRNSLEHQFSDAPPKTRCEEYIKFTWYFLRSTDYWVKEIYSDLYLETSLARHYFVELDLNINKGWELELSGLLPQELCSIVGEGEPHQLNVENIEFGYEFIEKFKSEPDSNEDGHWDGLKGDDVLIKGAKVGCPKLKKEIIKQYFAKI